MIKGLSGLSVNNMPIFWPFSVFCRACVRMLASGVFLGKLSFMFVGVRERIRLISFSFVFSVS